MQMRSAIPSAFRKTARTSLALLALTAFWVVTSRAREVGTRSGEGSATMELPLSFEPNRGQSDNAVQFVARGPGYTLYLNEEGSSFQWSSAPGKSAGKVEPRFAVKFAGQKKSKSNLLGLDEQPSQSSYFTGSDPKKWLTGIPNFRRVARRGVYDGIDVTYRGSQGQLECEFKIAPHAVPASISLEIIGARGLHKDPQGDVVFTVANVAMRLHRPTAYQKANGASHAVASHYLVRGNFITVRVGAYDPGKLLFLNPVLSYSGLLKTARRHLSPREGVAPRGIASTPPGVSKLAPLVCGHPQICDPTTFNQAHTGATCISELSLILFSPWLLY
jgi:hypothetical protein